MSIFLFFIAFIMIGFVAAGDYYYRQHGYRDSRHIKASDIFTVNHRKVRFSAHELTPLLWRIFGDANCRNVNLLERFLNKKLFNEASDSQNDALISSLCLFFATLALGYLTITFFIDNEFGYRFAIVFVLSLSCLAAFGNVVRKYFAIKDQKFLSNWRKALFNDVSVEVLTSILLKMDNSAEVMERIAQVRDDRNGKSITGADVLVGIVHYHEAQKGNEKLIIEKMISHYSGS